MNIFHLEENLLTMVQVSGILLSKTRHDKKYRNKDHQE